MMNGNISSSTRRDVWFSRVIHHKGAPNRPRLQRTTALGNSHPYAHTRRRLCPPNSSIHGRRNPSAAATKADERHDLLKVGVGRKHRTPLRRWAFDEAGEAGNRAAAAT